jgi:hypothetical protein
MASEGTKGFPEVAQYLPVHAGSSKIIDEGFELLLNVDRGVRHFLPNRSSLLLKRNLAVACERRQHALMTNVLAPGFQLINREFAPIGFRYDYVAEAMWGERKQAHWPTASNADLKIDRTGEAPVSSTIQEHRSPVLPQGHDIIPIDSWTVREQM